MNSLLSDEFWKRAAIAVWGAIAAVFLVLVAAWVLLGLSGLIPEPVAGPLFWALLGFLVGRRIARSRTAEHSRPDTPA